MNHVFTAYWLGSCLASSNILVKMLKSQYIDKKMSIYKKRNTDLPGFSVPGLILG